MIFDENASKCVGVVREVRCARGDIQVPHPATTHPLKLEEFIVLPGLLAEEVLPLVHAESEMNFWIAFDGSDKFLFRSLAMNMETTVATLKFPCLPVENVFPSRPSGNAYNSNSVPRLVGPQVKWRVARFQPFPKSLREVDQSEIKVIFVCGPLRITFGLFAPWPCTRGVFRARISPPS